MTPGKVFRQYECGCVFDYGAKPYRLRLDEKTKSNQWKRIKVCPDCRTQDARFKFFFKFCPECGKTITTVAGSLPKGRCKECGKKAFIRQRKKRVSLKERVEIFVADKQRRQAAMDCYDCINRDYCLDQADDKDEYLPCYQCAGYWPEKIEAIVYDRRDHDPFEWAYGMEEAV